MTKRLALIACDVLKNELEMLIGDDPDFISKEYVEFALHIYPDELVRKLVDKINALDGKVDAVFLAYGICQSLGSITKLVNVPTVNLQVDDCIAALLTPSEYEAEKRKCSGTWFASPGWAEIGIDGAIKELHLDCMKDEGYPPEFFLKMIYTNYSRTLFVDTGVPDIGRFEKLSEGFARELDLKHESRKGTLDLLKEGISRTKAMAANKVDDAP